MGKYRRGAFLSMIIVELPAFGRRRPLRSRPTIFDSTAQQVFYGYCG